MKTVLVFSGYNVRAVFAFLRTLEAQRLDYAIIARDADDPVLWSAYQSKVAKVRSTQALEIDSVVELLSEVTGKLGSDGFLLAPSTEALNRFLLTHRARIEALGIDVPLVAEDLYHRISDKAAFLEVCKTAGLDAPETYPDFASAPLPFVAKPRRYVGPASGEVLRPILIETEAAQHAFEQDHSAGDFFFQELVAGHSYYLLYYFFGDGREPLVYSQENLVQQAGGQSVLAAVNSDVHEGPIADQYRDLFLELGYVGLVMVEVRGSGTALKMIEANPRFWGPSQLFVDTGANLFEAFLDDNGIPVDPAWSPNAGNATRYFWDDGESFNDDRIAETLFHNYSAAELAKSYADWDQVNLFRRPDTMALYADFTRKSDLARSARVAKLRRQYSETSKHSNYQVLAPRLAALIPAEELQTRSRHEEERFAAISETINLQGKTVLDIGGNTGYFTFAALDAGAEVTYCEGNQAHADFVATGRDILDLQDRLDIRQRYFLFDNSEQGEYDVVLLLNVLHHVGDDFGDSEISIENARKSIVESLINLSRSTRQVVLQLGFNWKGDVNLPLFPNGTKREMLEFLRDELADTFKFDRILVADRQEGHVSYADLDDTNIERRDDLGEFLNRPLLFLSVKA